MLLYFVSQNNAYDSPPSISCLPIKVSLTLENRQTDGYKYGVVYSYAFKIILWKALLFSRLSKNRMLTKGQREAVSDFLVALTSAMQPSMLLKLLRKLTVDVSKLSEYTTVALRVSFNEQLWRIYVSA